MNHTERNNKLREVLAKFKNGEKLYREDQIFHNVVETMARDGINEFDVIEYLISVNKQSRKDFEDYIKRAPMKIEIHGDNNKIPHVPKEERHNPGRKPHPPKPPLSRTIREGIGVFCPICHSTMTRTGWLGLLGERRCDNKECENSKRL